MTDSPGSTTGTPGENEPEPDWDWVNESPDWVPPVIDTSKPSVARVYDYGLGGKDNYPVDRELAEKFFAIVPDGPQVARGNRAFLATAVREMADAGISQFLDLGSGLPTSPSVHETARQVHPDAAVVYVDNDPIVLAHNRAMLLDDDRIVTIPRDIREPAAVLGDQALRRLLDLDQPIGLLFIAVLHFVDVASAPAVVSRYIDLLPPGSRIAITATTAHGIDPETLRQTAEIYGKATGTALVYRTKTEIERLFEGTELIAPLQDVYRSETMALLGGVGVKV